MDNEKKKQIFQKSVDALKMDLELHTEYHSEEEVLLIKQKIEEAQKRADSVN